MRKSPFSISAVGVFLVAFLAVVQAQNISTLAGGGPNNLPAGSSAIGTPWALAQDGNGNTYISDNLSNRVFKVDKNGVLTVLAGNIFGSYRGDNHLGTVASLNSPEGVAVDTSGNVYIADTINNAIRVVNTQSSPITLGGLPPLAPLNINTIAGGTLGYSATPTLATSASLNSPGGVWLDKNNNVYIADTVNSVIEVVNTQSSAITVAGVTIQPNFLATVAGINQAGFSGDGGLASAAKISQPLGLFVDTKGNIFIADTMNNRIRVVNTQTSAITVATVTIQPNDIKTVAGNGTEGFSGDGSAATSAELNHPSAVFVDATGNIYIADGDGDLNGTTSNNRIRKVTTDGTINTIAGSATPCFYNLAPCGDGGLATSAMLWAPTGVVVDSSGNVFIADQNDDAIREVSSQNIHTTMGILLDTAFSGDASPGPPVIQGIATNAELRSPAGVVSDSSGNVYITDSGNAAIRKVNSSGIITTVVGCLVNPCGDNVPATSARLFGPSQTAFDSAGNMYIAEAGNGGNDIRFVNNQTTPITFYTGQTTQVTIKPGFIGTVAGTIACTVLNCGDGGLAGSAQLNQPEGLFVDASGNIYIADTSDNAIRVVNTQPTLPITVAGVTIAPGNIETVAGTLDISPTGDCPIGTSACGDGGPAINAQLSLPVGVTVDSAGNIYIADAADNRVRIVSTSGTINKFAGTGAPCQNSCGDGGLAIDALLDAPQGLFVDYAGDVFIADTFDYSIREVTPDGNINAVVDSSETPGFFGDGSSALSAELTNPTGVAADPFGNLLIADTRNWRARKVSAGSVITAPRADLSTNLMLFSAHPLKTTSAGQTVTVTNDGFGTALTITNTGTLSGTNSGDFSITANTCTGSLPPGSACAITLTFTPSAKGPRVATLTLTDNAGGVPGTQQPIALSGIGVVATALDEQIDYFAEGKADFTVWRPSTATFYTVSTSGKTLTKAWGVSTDIPVIGDFDGDGKTDVGVWRPANGTWYISQSSNGKELIQAWGAKGDISVPGDYDGDGKTDFAVWRPSNGTWYVIQSSTGKAVNRAWGQKGDIPVPGDYDGDGKTDFAVYRPSTGTWYIIQSSTGKVITKAFGIPTDLPVPADYEGDGKADIAVWRPSTGTFYAIQSSTGREVIQRLGQKGDVPVSRDYDGDGKADFAIWHPPNGTWSVIQSSTGKTITKAWGLGTDIPLNKPIGQ